MTNFRILTRAAAISTVVAFSALSTTAYAGEAERARAAIAEAKGKIEAGDKVGASGEAAGLQTQARAALQSAQERLAHGKKAEAIADAQQAGALADQAIVVTDKRKVAMERNGRLNAESSAVAAQQSAADANARADSAQQSAAVAAAQADALRNAPAPAPAPAPTTTTVVEKEIVRTPVRHTTRRVVHKPVTAVAEKTTTTITTGQPQ